MQLTTPSLEFVKCFLKLKVFRQNLKTIKTQSIELNTNEIVPKAPLESLPTPTHVFIKSLWEAACNFWTLIGLLLKP